jgi:hypothetical protein
VKRSRVRPRPQALASSPQGRSLVSRCQQGSIRAAANTHTENAVTIDHCHDFVVRGDGRSALRRQKSGYTAAIPKAAKRQFNDHGRVAKHGAQILPTELGDE